MSPSGERPSGNVTLALLSWALWLALAGRSLGPELVLGAIAAAVAAWLLRKIRIDVATLLRPPGVRWLPFAATRLARDLVTQCSAVLARILGRETPPGRFLLRHSPTCYGGNGVDGVAQEARLLLRESFFPNQYALGVDRRGARLVIHELAAWDE